MILHRSESIVFPFFFLIWIIRVSLVESPVLFTRSYLFINLLDHSVNINPKLFIPSFFLLILTIWFSQAVKSVFYISHWYEFIDYTCK